jgi:hypothetical protein
MTSGGFPGNRREVVIPAAPPPRQRPERPDSVTHLKLTLDRLSPNATAELLKRLANMPLAFVVEESPRPVHEVMADCEKRGVEHITGVAIRVAERVWQLFWPCRHCHVLHMLSQTVGDIGEHEQGFVTSTGRFVDRIEGAEVALRAGQTARLQWPPSLYSEDLW